VKVAYAEIAKSTGSPKFWRTAKRFTAETSLLDGSKVIYAGIIANYHSVTFTDLEPNTVYCYRVGDDSHWSEWIQFKTASATNDKFSFLYVGDAQDFILELWSRILREGFRQAPNARFIVHAGDLVSESHSERQWEEWFRAGSFIHSMIPSFPVAGNHEYGRLYEDSGKEGQLSLQWRPQFTLPENGPDGIDELKETAYYMDFQGVRMISFNSIRFRDEQAEWLKQILADNPNRWTIVTMHYPLYSAAGTRNNERHRNLLKPIFDEYGVDLVLQGHDHCYARGRVAPAEYNITDGVNKRDQTGTVYVVSVSGGKMYDLNKQDWEQWGAQKDREAENTQLAQVITVDKDTVHYKSFTATGELYDAFDIIKNKKGPNTFIERKDEGIGARYHHNTISYFDELPSNLEKIILDKYKDVKIGKVSIRPNEKNEGIIYDVKMSNKNSKIMINIDENGEILWELIKPHKK
jgi:3',5'-cyclic AMP phosphodiesterase CpdA